MEDELDALERCFDHISLPFRDRRRELYRRLHASGRRLLRSEAHGGFWYVPSYALALAAQRDPETFSNKRFTIPERPVPPLIPATLDPPEHMPFKIMLSSYFTPAVARQLEPRLRATADELIARGCGAGRFDMVQDVMFPLMATFTMGDMLGLEVAKAHDYALPVHHMTQRDYPADKAHAELQWLGDQLAGDIREGRVDPEGILGQLAVTEIQGRRLTEDELRMIAINLLIGGMGTTAFFMGSVAVFLGRNSAHRAQLISEPSLMPSAIDELLRCFSPTQSFGRTIAKDVVLDDTQLKAGEKLLIGYGCANFDPSVFPDPQRIDFRRSPNPHMSFGIGPHRCLGSHIARMVAAIVTERLLHHAPAFALIEEEVIEQDEKASMFGFNHVPMRPTEQAR